MIRPLTGIRGVAACSVVLYHYLQSDAPSHLVQSLIGHGYMAVDLFFVLSGFVMGLTYAADFANGMNWRTHLTFLGKRLGRIFPLYAFVTITTTALILTGLIKALPPTMATLIANLFLVQTWGLAGSIAGPSWSISTEFAAYLLFPVFVAAFISVRGAYASAAVLVCLAALVFIATRSAADLHQLYNGTVIRSGPLDVYGVGTPYPLLRCFAGFGFGLALFRAASKPPVRQALRSGLWADAAVLLVLALWATRGNDVLLVIAFGLLILTLATSERSLTAKLLGTALVYWLGEVSYSIYLLHQPVDEVIRLPLLDLLNSHTVPHAFTLVAAISFASTIALSVITFYWLEKPARNLVRQLMHVRLKSIADEPAAP